MKKECFFSFHFVTAEGSNGFGNATLSIRPIVDDSWLLDAAERIAEEMGVEQVTILNWRRFEKYEDEEFDG